MREPRENVRFVSKKYSQKMRRNYEHVEPEFLIGKSVKLGFKSSDGRIEHMWVWVIAPVVCDGDCVGFKGILDNEPIMDVGFQYGEGVLFKKKDIEVIYDGWSEL